MSMKLIKLFNILKEVEKFYDFELEVGISFYFYVFEI